MTKYSIKKPFTVLVAVVLVLVLGVVSFLGLKTDLLPKMELPYVIVMTTAPGQSPERVETTVTKPLESALATTSGLENMQSMSMENVSIVIMEFSASVNMDSAMIEMSSNIDMVEGYFEETVSSPMLMKLNPDMLPVQVLSVDMDGMDVKELSAFIENDIAPYLERIDGVATVDTTGLIEDYIDIELDQDKIDEINDTVLYHVDKELYDAKKELDDAKKEFEDGKQELADGLKEFEDKRDEAYGELGDAKAQLDAGKSQLNDIVNQKTTIEANIKFYEGQKLALQGYMAQIMPAISAVPGLSDIYNLLSTIEIDGVKLSHKTFTEILSIDVTSISDAALKASVEGAQTAVSAYAADSNIITLDSGKIEFEKQLRTLGLSDTQIANAAVTIGEIDGKIGNANTELTDVAALAAQLQKQVAALQNTYGDLEKAQMAAVTEFGAAQAQLEMAEKQMETAEEQIEDGYNQFNDARKEALKQANIDSLVTQSMISTILTAQNFSMPAGYINAGENRLTVKVGEKFADVQSLENLMLVDMGIDGMAPIYLRDVANVTMKDNSGDSFVKINGNDGIVMSFNKSSVASTSEVSDDVTAAVKELEERYPGLHITTLMDQGDYINMIVKSVLSNLIYGGLIALLVLVIFLKSARPTAIIAMSIPLSVLCAIVAMYFTDVTLNIISLSGLALAVGMLVDNSIVVIENIYRLRSMGYAPVKAAVVGTKQVGGAIAASTLTTICVFLPIVFTEGLTRQIFTDMGLTIGFVLVASLIVALTFVPCLASFMLGKTSDVSPKFVQKLTDGYAKLLEKNLQHKWVVIALSVGLLALSVFNALRMPMAFIPAMDGPQMSMTFTLPIDTSDEELYEKGWEIAQKAQTVQDVDTVAVMSGGAGIQSMMSSTDGVSLSYYVVLNEERTLSNKEVASRIEALFPEYDEELTVTSESVDMSMLGGSGLSVTIKGNDFDKLGEISKDIANELTKIEGIKSADDGSGERTEELRIEIDKAAAMKEGLTTAQVYQMIAQELTDETTTTTFTFDGKDLDGYITYQSRYNAESIKDFVVVDKLDEDKKEHIVTLGEIATISKAQTPDSIIRDNQSRTYTVSASFADGANTTLVSREAEEMLNAYDMPDGYQLEVGGENKMVMEALGDMALMILLAIVFIYLIMVAQFQSLMCPFIVLFTIPLAFTGGLLALQLTGTVLSIVSMIGFLVLTGVVVNNGIVFIDYVNQLRAEGKTMREALVQTGVDRIRPILMTALTTILAMSTMAFGVGMGAEMSQGMAIVSIGGLAYATLLTLFLVPALYEIMHKKPLKVIDVDFEDEENA